MTDFGDRIMCKKCHEHMGVRSLPDGVIVIECPKCGTKDFRKRGDRVEH